jgi:protein-S-isoprenylcysteine O-methyltransferase Ste14
MEVGQEKNNTVKSSNHKYVIHSTLAHSYTFYFAFFLLGVLMDLIFKIRIFETSVMLPGGFILLILGTVIILWAQLSYVNLDGKEITKEHFCKGPYCYTRTPTHWGIFLLMLGFGFIVNGLFIILSTVISHLLAKVTFVKRYETAMLRHFGAPYEEYKKSMKI